MNELADRGQASIATVLVVDDDNQVLRMVSKMVKDGGYKVLEAENAVQALKLCESRGLEISLVLTDIVMQGQNGFQLAAHIRRLYPDMKVMFMTGYYHDKVEQETEGKIICKPFNREQLLREISKYFLEA